MENQALIFQENLLQIGDKHLAWSPEQHEAAKATANKALAQAIDTEEAARAAMDLAEAYYQRSLLKNLECSDLGADAVLKQHTREHYFPCWIEAQRDNLLSQSVYQALVKRFGAAPAPNRIKPGSVFLWI